MICCYDVMGKAVMVAPEAITFRPAVYGIFIENQQIILLKHSTTSLWYPPGRILESHEIPSQIVRYEFRGYTDMLPTLGPLLFVEDQYRMDENGRSWHLSVLYYTLSRASTSISVGMNFKETAVYEWVPLSSLTREQMLFGYEAIQAGQLREKA